MVIKAQGSLLGTRRQGFLALVKLLRLPSHPRPQMWISDFPLKIPTTRRLRQIRNTERTAHLMERRLEAVALFARWAVPRRAF